MPFKQPLGERDAANRVAPTFIRPLADKRAVVGETIILECQLEGHPDPAIKWLKDGHNVSMCPDYRIEEDGLKHRLVIPQVQAADSGRFTAQASNVAGTKQSTCILICAPAPTPVPGAKSAVASPAPPQTPVGPSAPIFLKELRHQPLKPGAGVTFEGRVISVPPPNIEWMKNGKPLQNYRAKIEHDPKTGIISLIIPQMFNDDAGEYTIKATNVHGEAISGAQLLPREQYDRWFANEQTRLTKDRKQGMLSQTLRPSSVAQKQMQKQGYDTDQGSVDMHWTISESETEPELSALDARGVGTKPIIRTPLRGLRLTEGTDAILQANIVGNPKPRIQWHFNGRPLQLSGPRMQMTYKGSMAVLKISMVTIDEAGDYTVVSENRFGKVESSARIEVYPLNVPDERRKENQLREQQERDRQQQALVEAGLAQQRQRDAEQRRIRDEQDRLRVLFEREKAERERLEEERRQLEHEKRLRQQQQQELFEREKAEKEERARFEEERHRLEHEKRLRQQQQTQPYHLQYPQHHHQQHQPHQAWQDFELVHRPQYASDEYQEPHYAQIRPHQQQQQHRQEVSHQNLYEQHRRQQQLNREQQIYQQQHHHHQQQQQEHQTPFHHFNQYQQHLRDHHQNTMPVFRQQQPTQVTNGGPKAANGFAKTANGSAANGSAKNGSAIHAANGGGPSQSARGHEHGAALVNARPPQFLVHPQSVAAKAFETVTFSAKVVGTPTPQLTWQKSDGTVIQSGGKYKIETGPDGSGRLIIEKVDAHDADMYMLVARNEGGSFQSRFSLNVLQAKSPEAPEFTGKFQSTTLYDGDSVKLYCKAAGEGVSFRWFKDNEPISSGGSYNVDSKGNETTLHINNATLKEGGWYRCDATNKHGTTTLKGRVVVNSRQKFTGPAHREMITLRKVDKVERSRTPVNQLQDVAASKSAPKFEGSLQSQQLIEGQSARLEIKYTPVDDPNLRIAWLLNGKAILASSRIATLTDFGIAALEINPVTVFDQGEYTIVAVNPLGEARVAANIAVVGHGNFIQQGQSGTQFGGTTYQSKGAQAPAGVQLDLPNFHSDLRSQEIFEGQPIHLETKLTPINDKSLKVTWLLNGKELPNNDKYRQALSHGFATLDIPQTSKDDSGYYSCRASNQLGDAENQATIIVHPKVELHQFEQNSQLDVDDVREIQFAHSQEDQTPKFISQLKPFHCEQELGRSIFEARIQPINDPSLRVSWLKDGQPLPNANRIQIFQNFGVVSLSLHPTYPEDAGVYTCVLFNSHGQAQSSAELTTVWIDTLQFDTKHADSLPIIGYLDSHQIHIGPQTVDRPEEFNSLEAPKFARELTGKIEVMENEPVHFEARIQPANDVKMTVEWYHNGSPLPAAHRFRPMFDFGYVALDLLYAYPQDSGTYTLVARNELGEARSNVELVVGTEKVLYLEPHHPEGLERIKELEQDRRQGIAEVEDRTCDAAPKFLNDIQDIELHEHENIHVDLRVTPVNDPTMVIEWFVNGRPLLTGSRVKTLNEFGFIALDIKGAIAEDSGTYSVRASNMLGEAIRQCQITVIPAGQIMSDTQHQESLGKINYLENLNKYGRVEVEDKGPDGPPNFVVPLQADLGDIEEGEPIHLECQVNPINDNTLKIVWLRDGQPIPHGHRFRTFYDFGFVSLDILGFYAQDAGTYTCRAENSLGQAETQTTIRCAPKDAILGAVQHPRSYARIQEIEAPKPPPQEVPDLPQQPPAFVKQLGPAIQCMEGDNVYLEAQVTPTDDNTLTYEWLVNGQPLMKAHRFVLSQDFGYIALNILYCYPEDNGTYTLVVRNRAGEAQSSVDINCGHTGGNFTDSFHPNSLGRIAELEAPIQRAEPLPDKEKELPKIVKTLPPTIDSVHESQTLHLEAQVTPIDDNTLRYEWLFNGNPLKASSRYRVLNDFGFVSLDIDYIIAEDSGKYTLAVYNAAGRAETSCEFKVDRLKSILSDTAHPESLRRIREMEQLQPAKPSDDDGPAQPPVFTQALTGPTEPLKEGQSVHMDCVVQPINDPSLKIEWFHDGRPLMFGSRIRTIHDFGYVGLEFLHVHPEDTGTYTCKATNLIGEATTDIFLECKSRRNIYLDTHHESSWVKIQEIENRVDEREPTPELTFQPPTFTENLADKDDAQEGQAIRLECRLIPVNDPTMRVTWTRNGDPLPEASRFMPARNFDYVNLDILALYGEDSGVYTCKAVSAFGEAATSCNVKCAATKSLLLDTMHDASWQRVQEIENRPKMEAVDDEPEKSAPKFVTQLNNSLGELQEGVPIHLECQVEPTNDSQLTVQWYHNGQPLANGHRFRTRHDFGYVALDILYAFAQDTGEWACVARNALGEAQTVANFTVLPRGTIYTDSQHPESWQKIQVLEAPKAAAPEQPDAEHDAPQFIEPLESLERIEFQPAHFQTKVTPQTDPNLRIQWFKDGQPLRNSNRFKLTTDFGYISLDIAHTIPEDSGVYSVKASNAKGEAEVQAQLTVSGNASILGNTQHEQSWQKIQLIEAPRAPGEEAPDVKHGPPKFVTQLHSLDGVVEGQPSHFEAQFIPFSDPRTSVQWYLNGQPLSASSRRILRNDFGLVSLDLQYTLGEDAGEYSVVVKNSEGEDRTNGSLSCTTRAAILGDTQHAQSWQRIQEIEAPRAPGAEPEGPVYDKPSFIQPLQSVGDLPEGSVALLEARLVPVNDPNLRVQWFFNDQPLMESNWISTSNDFGCVSLRIAPVYARHTGVYSCKAWNESGNAVTSANVGVQGSEGLLLDTSHPVSLQKIQELEAIDKYARLDAPEREFDKPQWVQGFENYENVGEGQTVTLHGLVEPSGDPTLQIEWLLNGTPLRNANRFRQELEFGNAILTIVHVLPHDSGVYTCRAWNIHGEASTSATVTTAGYEKILYDSQHPVSWERIQELEAPKIVEEIEEVIQKEKPNFITQLESAENVPEGVPLHLEATFQPARDSELKAVWQKNGQPLGASQLVQTKHELGWATLDISSVNEDHNGVYTLTISNSEGEAVSTASIRVAGTGPILGDTRHEESWKRIQILEAPKEAEPDAPAPVYDHPAINTQIEDKECNEGDHVHFEALITPVNDPRLQVQWIRNGVPLAHGSKYAIQQDFGICTLDIAYTYPEDEGIYQLRIWNPEGEAVSSATLKCHGKDAILGDVQHQESWKRIQEIEAPKPKLEEADPEPKGPPRFIQQLSSPGDLVETQPAHFEATVEPVDDPTLTISWFLNGQPMSASSRVKMINDFGWVIMDIAQTEPRDSGEWKCVAKNAAGEASSTATINVQGKEVILQDSLQPQSLDRIRQIEAGKPAPTERPDQEFEAPVIVNALQVQGALEEGGSAHLQTQFTPVADPSIKVEWLKDGQPIFHSNRYKMVHDFGFAVLDILHLLKHDAGEYTFRVTNRNGDASTSTSFQVAESSGLILQPQNEQKARAVETLEENLRRRPEEVEQELKEATPVFIEPLSAPVETEEGGRAHFTARYEPVNDNQLQVQWYHDGRPLKNGSRIKTINSFGYVVLEISPTYPEDNGEYTCRAVNRVGEAVTSTKLTCSPKEGIISATQLPERMANAGRRIAEIEAPRPAVPDAPDADHGPPKFTSALAGPPELQEGQQAHLECQVTPVADPRLKIEWFHDGQPVKHTNRMKVIHDFGFVVLQLTPAEPQDSGTWTCRATNQHGSDEVSTEIKVVGGGGVSYEWQSPAQRKERITELEDWIHRPKEDLNLPPVDYPAPTFSQDLTDLGQLNEADATAFVCVLEPIGDPTLRVQWEHNGHPIPYSNRISCTNEFGVATLLIKHLIAADAGEYKCVATNAKGSATSTGHVAVESATQIDAPQVVQQLVDSVENILEGDSIHLECRVTPINDPRLRVEWLRNGAPLPEASRFKPTFEFGFVSLDILYAYPEDNGDYELVVINDKGEARSKTKLTVLPRPSLDYTSQTHGNQQDSLESHFKQHSQTKLQLTANDIYNESDKRAPEFRTQLQNIGVLEGEFCRFETQVAPINDPYLKVEWFKDKKPVLLGHRFRSTLDFGFACLDLLYALPDDTGEYHCVATNRHGQTMISAKLACQGASHVITDSQMPQGLRVSNVKKDNKNIYWSEQGGPAQPKQKQAPQFTIPLRNLQVTENQPARFECAVTGYPRPKVTWYINKNQCLHGHRFKLNFDGLHYLTVSKSRISDAGEVVAIARNTEGERISTATLDIFQNDDFRQAKLRPANFKTSEELRERELQWQRDTLGSLGPAFEAAPKPDAQKLMHVERAQSPIEPLESQELIQKFTRPRDDQFYNKLSYVELQKPQFKGMELEAVNLKAGKVEKYQPPVEEMERVNLKAVPDKEQKEVGWERPDWAGQEGGSKLPGADEGRFKKLPTPPPELDVPARDQVKLKTAKPTRGKDLEAGERVKLQTEKAKIKEIQQKPEQPKEEPIVHKDTVQLKTQQLPKTGLKGDHFTVDREKDLKETPAVVKPVIEETRISNKPQPTKIGQSKQAPPTISQQLKPLQGELGKAAKFVIEFAGAAPVKVTWLKDGKEIKSTFRSQINTTPTSSSLHIGRLENSHSGEYTVRLENAAGTVESLANLTVAPPSATGKAPDFSARLNDLRIQQNGPAEFSCQIGGEPKPTIQWFKDGQPLPNDDRFQVVEEGGAYKLKFASILPTDAGIYEIVAKNGAGEARCKARLNVNLQKTGKGAEEGPRYEAPRFTSQIQPIVVDEGKGAQFSAKFSGFPEPTIRWYRNNEPVKHSDGYEISQSKGEAILRISGTKNEDVAEYKVEASNPAGKASSVANLVLTPRSGRIAKSTISRGGSAAYQSTDKAAADAPHFVAKLSDISARQGHTVKFSAEVDGNPEPSVIWQFKGKPITASNNVKISREGKRAILELARVTPDSAGEYQIVIRNDKGAATSQAKLTLSR
ncbi:hypothetical protein L3Y34_007185 [Caenorhabditis briggsae]|uniref:Ig-like domain-containing protein n=2 Tax=Caenorhabditis briggsae TaxID=6238 RepID=A0AAE8ZY60_CAEBR|nr:hypothetical protein L3Y34_007185 [Caenorhabditis briggsae]